MNIVKNVKITASVILLVLPAIFAGACQTANTNSAHTATGGHAMNMAAHGNSMSANTANMSNMAAHAGHDMSGMGHSEMTSDPNAASQPYDLQFIDTMSAEIRQRRAENIRAENHRRSEKGNRADEGLARKMVCGKTGC
jgi:hypothetical protein